ncbi:hypothetical protein QYE76_000320 [Lolium multiflorum]|uniref:MATH domain-containing protein n=1 Tax=Lolium multiflorum TaxID=4521 RepID=A0AAD8RJT8_LOLMU|nr:hypothetical protein QYE76_000320 [Lolium multiflorum]
MNRNSNIESASRHIHLLLNTKGGILKGSVFWPAVKVLLEDPNILANTYVYELVNNFDTSSEELTLSPQNIVHIRNKAHHLFPLPSGQFMFKHRKVRTTAKEMTALKCHVKDKYDLDLQKYERRDTAIADLWLKIIDEDLTEAQLYILFAIAFTTSVVSPSRRVNLKILPDIIPYERIPTLNWLAFAVDELVCGAKTGNGCLYILHRAKKVYENANVIPSPPRGSLLVDDRNVGTFSGTTTVCDLGSLNSSAKTELDLLREEIQHRISLLKSIDDQINVDEEHGAEHGANQSHLVDENMLFSDDGNEHIPLGDNHGNVAAAAGEGDEDAGAGVIQQVNQGDNHGNVGAAAGEGDEDAGAGVIQQVNQAPVQEQIPLADNHGNNQGVSLIADGKLMGTDGSSPTPTINAKAASGYHLLVVEGHSRTAAHRPLTCIRSRPFIIGGHRWCILYYPHGRSPDDAGFISLHLSSEHGVKRTNFEFSFVDETEKQEPARIRAGRRVPIYGCYSAGYGRFVKRDALEKSKHLKDDNFTIRCDVVVAQEDVTSPCVEVPPSNMKRNFTDLLLAGEGAEVVFLKYLIQGGVDSIGRHVAEGELGEVPPEAEPSTGEAAHSCGGAGAAEAGEDLEQHLVRKVADPVRQGRRVPTTTVRSRPFIIGGHRWCILYYPHGRSPDDAGFISLHLSSEHGVKRTNFEFSFVDETKKQEPARIHAGRRVPIYGCYSAGYGRFVKRDALEKSKHLKDDSFTIRCDVVVAQEDVTSPCVEVPPSNMKRNFTDLLLAGEGADVVFRSTATLSPPTAASSLPGLPSSKPMKEGSMGTVVQIDDMDATVFKAMLVFIYGDSMPAEEGGDDGDGVVLLQHLLVAADMYGIPRLSAMCEKKLCEHIGVSTAMSILALADHHGCHGLKEACFEFLSCPVNLRAVVAMDGFDHLCGSCPPLIKELVIDMLQPAGA